MNRYKIYLATDIEVTAENAEIARNKALCSFMSGLYQAEAAAFLKVVDVTMMYVPEHIAPEKQKKNRIFGGLL